MNTEVRYLHLRRRRLRCTKQDSLLTEYSAVGGVTVAYRKSGLNQYKCAFTRCNVKDGDRYNKSTGRHKAHLRLLEADDVWMLDMEEGANVAKKIVELIYGVKKLRRALRPELRT